MSYQRPDDNVKNYIRIQVAAGFESPETITENATDIYEEEPATAERLVDAAVTAHKNEQAAWPTVTDCDRLDSAFLKLDASGLLSRQHFTCCNRCGHGEMADLVHTERENGHNVEGYAFYHWQDTDNAVAGAPLHIRYASMSDSPEAKSAIGNRVVEALRAEGLSVDWSGNPEETATLVPFQWQRRVAPVDTPAPTWTPGSMLERWCRRLPVADAAEYSRLLGETYPETAVAAGELDHALTWARSTSMKTPIDGCSRSRALLLVGRALRNDHLLQERIPDLLIEAVAATPYGQHGDLADALAAASLEQPRVRQAAHERATQTQSNTYGAAAIAWYLVRAQTIQEEQNYHDALLDDVQRVFDSPSNAYDDDDTARAAIASALWVLRTRRGEADLAESARESALELVSSPSWGAASMFPKRCLVAAAQEIGVLSEVAPLLFEVSDVPWIELAESFAHAGEAVSVPDVMEAPGAPHWLPARLARLLPDDSRAADWIAKVDVGDEELATLYEEGMLTDEEMRDTRLELAAWRASHGESERCRSELAAVAQQFRSELKASGQTIATHLENVANGTCGPALPSDESWFDSDGAERLERALAKWDAATDRRGRIRARHAAATILTAAAAIANDGASTRARSLISRVVGDAEDVILANAALVSAWIATDQLDLALAHTDSTTDNADTIIPIVVHLGGLGRKEEALELLGPALDRAESRNELHAIVPAILAVSDSPKQCAREMVASWERSSAALNALEK